jgi:hypothetical protein
MKALVISSILFFTLRAMSSETGQSVKEGAETVKNMEVKVISL